MKIYFAVLLATAAMVGATRHSRTVSADVTRPLARLQGQEESKKALADLQHRVGGIIYNEVWLCDWAVGRRFNHQMVCNEKEYNGKFWVKINDTSQRFKFQPDGTVSISDVNGTPHGPHLEDIDWRCEGGDPAWVYITQDGMEVIFSCQRPVDQTLFRPNIRYSYEMLKAH